MLPGPRIIAFNGVDALNVMFFNGPNSLNDLNDSNGFIV